MDLSNLEKIADPYYVEIDGKDKSKFLFAFNPNRLEVEAGSNKNISFTVSVLAFIKNGFQSAELSFQPKFLINDLGDRDSIALMLSDYIQEAFDIENNKLTMVAELGANEVSFTDLITNRFGKMLDSNDLYKRTDPNHGSRNVEPLLTWSEFYFSADFVDIVQSSMIENNAKHFDDFINKVSGLGDHSLTASQINWVLDGNIEHRLKYLTVVDSLMAEVNKLKFAWEFSDNPSKIACSAHHLHRVVEQNLNVLEREIDSGNITRSRDLARYVKNKYRLPSFNLDSLIKAVQYGSYTHHRNPEELIGLTLLPLDHQNTNFRNLLRDLSWELPDTTQRYTSDGVHRVDSVALVKNYIGKLASNLVQSHRKGEKKECRARLYSPYRFLFNSDKSVADKMFAWKHSVNLESFEDSCSFFEAMYQDIILGLIAHSEDLSNCDQTGSGIQFYSGRIDIDSYFLSEDIGRVLGYKLDEGDFFTTVEDLYPNQNIKESAIFAGMVHKKVIPRANQLRQEMYARVNMPGVTWDKFIDDLELNDKYTLVSLNSRDALTEEGEALKHCVSSYYQQAVNGECFILSVRDPDNMPVATLEVVENKLNDDVDISTQRFSLVQLKGYENSDSFDQEVRLLVDDFMQSINDGEIAVNTVTNGCYDQQAIRDNPIENRRSVCVVPTETIAEMDEAISLLNEMLPNGVTFGSILDKSPLLSAIHDNGFKEKQIEYHEHRAAVRRSKKINDQMIAQSRLELLQQREMVVDNNRGRR
ncbi:PcfJ domain-containing protein [Photobacterium leiognathi]|uniref:PcfJ domain-containing protein n=1 Tax=Photobacterium leiognathi TaxID=553611 RepID=UPI0029821BA2|nr:PcfJ domain-containing protein [Photobacterium leiognathi]